MPLIETVGKSNAAAEDRLVNVLQSQYFTDVEQRIIRQFIQTLIYEEILSCESKRIPIHGSESQLVLSGKDSDGQAVYYVSQGKRKYSFGRIRLDKVPVKRVMMDGSSTMANLSGFITEVLSQVQQGEPLERFAEELEQTLLKDVQAQSTNASQQLSADQRSYNELEGNIMDGHPYHPCYKSRIGFTLSDNAAYGPEFKQVLRPVWLAVSRQTSKMAHSESVTYDDVLRKELGDEVYAQFSSILTDQGKRVEDYRFMPVHPWQWREKIIPQFHRELAEKNIILLGESRDVYRPQQSIRTLSNFTFKQNAYLKLSLSITNTSTSRILAGHTVLNGALITDWLQTLIKEDEFAKRLDLVILREVLGVTYDYEKLPEAKMMRVYGMLGVIWRESVHQYLRSDEDAAPFNALCHVENNGLPFIDPWIQKYGVENWTKQMLQVAVSPIIHMLYAHGIGMESHGQNIVLIHKDGLPHRVALKDFHDGVRFSVQHLTEPEKCPDLNPEPASHAKINRNSFIKTHDPADVRDFTYDAFFFICLAELCMFLEEHYNVDEARFWAMTAQVIYDYQAEHPQHQVRFSLFDLFAETVQIEELTKRRLFGDGEFRFKAGQNPLYAFRKTPC